MVSPEWQANEPVHSWPETGLTDEQTAAGQEQYQRELEAVAARIDRFSEQQAGALTLYYLALDDIAPDIAVRMINAFGHRSKAGFASWLNDPDMGHRLIPFDAYIQNAPDLDREQQRFVAQTVAESITYADHRRYMTIMLDPSVESIMDPAQAAVAESTATDLSKQLIQQRDIIAEALIEADQDNYLAALNRLDQGNERMNTITEAATPETDVPEPAEPTLETNPAPAAPSPYDLFDYAPTDDPE